MTREELEKEAEEYAGTVHRYRDAQGETEQMEDVAEAWEKGYECCAKELEKENAELKENFRICEKNADTYFDNFTKAKGIIKNIIRVTWGEGWNYSLEWKVRAENFLKE